MKKEKEVLALIADDSWMLEVLEAARTLNLPDWWICAGFVRTKVWDTMHQYKERTRLGDIDVIYYDNENLDERLEKEYEKRLNRILPDLPWSVKNQARMHQVNGLPPYESSSDAISQFPETATALGVKLGANGELELTAPHGLADLIRIRVCPTPAFKKDDRLLDVYRQRLESKDWKRKWPRAEVVSVQ